MREGRRISEVGDKINSTLNSSSSLSKLLETKLDVFSLD